MEQPEPRTCSWSVVLSSAHLQTNAVGHLCAASLPVYSQRHQQNRQNGNALQVREMEGGGEDLSSSLITPLIACQVLTQQYSRPLPSSCPSAPPPPSPPVGEEVTLRHAHLQAIWLVTPIKRCRAEEPLGLLTPPTAALKDGASIWSHWGCAQALQGGFDLSQVK